MINSSHPITQGVQDFIVNDEQHYVEYDKDKNICSSNPKISTASPSRNWERRRTLAGHTITGKVASSSPQSATPSMR